MRAQTGQTEDQGPPGTDDDSDSTLLSPGHHPPNTAPQAAEASRWGLTAKGDLWTAFLGQQRGSRLTGRPVTSSGIDTAVHKSQEMQLQKEKTTSVGQQQTNYLVIVLKSSKTKNSSTGKSNKRKNRNPKELRV